MTRQCSIELPSGWLLRCYIMAPSSPSAPASPSSSFPSHLLQHDVTNNQSHGGLQEPLSRPLVVSGQPCPPTNNRKMTVYLHGAIITLDTMTTRGKIRKYINIQTGTFLQVSQFNNQSTHTILGTTNVQSQAVSPSLRRHRWRTGED